MDDILQHLDEESLVARCRTELPYVMDAFSELVRRHERYVFNLCRSFFLTKTYH